MPKPLHSPSPRPPTPTSAPRFPARRSHAVDGHKWRVPGGKPANCDKALVILCTAGNHRVAARGTQALPYALSRRYCETRREASVKHADPLAVPASPSRPPEPTVSDRPPLPSQPRHVRLRPFAIPGRPRPGAFIEPHAVAALPPEHQTRSPPGQPRREWCIRWIAPDLEACLHRAYARVQGEALLPAMDAPGSVDNDSLCLLEREGTPVTIGDADRPATPDERGESRSLLAYIRETARRPTPSNSVSEPRPAPLPYYSLDQLRADGGRPRNAMLNSGAMVLASLLPGTDPADRCARFAAWLPGSLCRPRSRLTSPCLEEVLGRPAATPPTGSSRGSCKPPAASAL